MIDDFGIFNESLKLLEPKQFCVYKSKVEHARKRKVPEKCPSNLIIMPTWTALIKLLF